MSTMTKVEKIHCSRESHLLLSKSEPQPEWFPLLLGPLPPAPAHPRSHPQRSAPLGSHLPSGNLFYSRTNGHGFGPFPSLSPHSPPPSGPPCHHPAPAPWLVLAKPRSLPPEPVLCLLSQALGLLGQGEQKGETKRWLSYLAFLFADLEEVI